MSAPTSLEVGIARLEGSFAQVERRLTMLEQDAWALRAEVVGMDLVLDPRIDRLFYWQLGPMVDIGASIQIRHPQPAAVTH